MKIFKTRWLFQSVLILIKTKLKNKNTTNNQREFHLVLSLATAMSDKDSDKSNDKDGFDPGAMMFGNFINYYQFHPPEDRIKLLTSHIWEQLELEKQEGPIVCLDVGCNCGVSFAHIF